METKLKIRNVNYNNDVTCPFCKENDFDLIGLKNHLLSGHCGNFNETLTVEEERKETEYYKKGD